MVNGEVLTIIVSILVPMFCGFGWILNKIGHLEIRMNGVERRLTIIETILAMMGHPIKLDK